MRRTLAAWLLTVGLAAAAHAAPLAPFPSHCRADEHAVVNARMSRVVQRPRGIDFVKNGKVLSLCADAAHEPFERLTYRYGAIGHVEFERSATRSSRFGIFGEATSPHTGENSVSFMVDGAAFRVAIATVQGSGVSLGVTKNHKTVVDLFSGNDEHIDFELGPATIDFDKVSSPIFVMRRLD